MKPDWKDAPEWAMWLAMDKNGSWHWFADQPDWDAFQWCTDGQFSLAADPINPAETLERRP